MSLRFTEMRPSRLALRMLLEDGSDELRRRHEELHVMRLNELPNVAKIHVKDCSAPVGRAGAEGDSQRTDDPEGGHATDRLDIGLEDDAFPRVECLAHD